MDYRTTVTGIGELVAEFIEQGMIIVFNDNAPAELAEMAVQHTKADMDSDVHVGDVIILGNKDYVVSAVGDEANHTLKSMGHCTFKFSGNSEVELPGHIELEGDGMPEIKVGDKFEIMFT